LVILLLVNMGLTAKVDGERLPSPISFTQVGNRFDPAVLVVCGTDGSGTRRVTEVLSELGAKMVYQDTATYDIHGKNRLMPNGWPEAVTPVLKQTHSLYYNVDDLPTGLKRTTLDRLSLLIDNTEVDNNNRPHPPLRLLGSKTGTKATAHKVSFGFKAPVAMTLAPFWATLLPHFKLVHVLRDGRDIAFSSNQSPVTKFFDAMYDKRDFDSSDYSDEQYIPAFKAIKLWSDWNTQLYDWAEHLSRNPSPTYPLSFEYLVVHTEDLVDPQLSIRFSAMYHIAQFVGSDMTDNDICCLALADQVYLGGHDDFKEANEQIRKKNKEHVDPKTKYGKWKTLLESDPDIARRLTDLGREGLQQFGYSPMREQASVHAATPTGYLCSVEKAKCPAAKMMPKNLRPK